MNCVMCGRLTEGDYPYCSEACERIDEERAEDFYEATKDGA